MSITPTAKQFSIATGTYRPMRWLSRRVRPSLLRAFHDDVDLYRALLPPGALCFDVGANIGQKSEALLRAGAARVVAFEPNPRVLPELRARCGQWKNWSVVEAALGSASGFATLYARALHGLARLSRFGPSQVNITPAEASTFHFAEWDRLERFLGWFPGDLKRSLSRDIYGDIFVKNDVA